MRLVHLSDLHLGFRQFDRMTPSGINVRENDIATSFSRAIGCTIALAPELVVIGGDVFHQVKPSNLAIRHAYLGFKRLRDALPSTEVVIVAGNHDTSRVADTGNILPLFATLGLHVVDGPAQRLDLPALDLEVLAVPDNHHARPVLRPSGTRRYNVLLLHGETGDIASAWTKQGAEIPTEALHAPDWSYCALGHYHVHHQVAPNAYYSGATDYSSSNVWGEVAEETRLGLPGKGLVERDLDTGAQTFHALPRSRDFVDLEPIGAFDMTPQQLDDAIALAVLGVEGGIVGKVVRLKITDVQRTVMRSLNHKALHRYRREALSFMMHPTPPEVVRAGTQAYATIGRRPPLEQYVRESLEKRLLPAGTDRAALVALGMDFLERAADPTLKVVTREETEAAAAFVKAEGERIAAGPPHPYELEFADAEHRRTA